MSWMRPGHGLDWSHGLFYLSLLLWVRRINGLADFSNYLSRIITSHSAHACDGQPLRLHCPRHSTISIQSAFYGSGVARLCQKPESSHLHRNYSCSAFTALQKLLSECQSQRDCKLSVNHLLFGKDPCPGTPKYLHVDYKCKPTEHKQHVACDGESLVLRCKPPKVLNIYAAIYGRDLGQSHTCSLNKTLPPPFECLNHEAVHFVSKSCYNKQRCAVAVSNQTFRDPCFPGTRKYLSVLYSCVPQSLLREADPSIVKPTSPPPVDRDEDEAEVFPKGSRRPEASGAVMSDSLSTYAYIKEHSEMAALLFTSSVCVGLLLTLLALSIRVTCWCHRPTRHKPNRQRPVQKQEEEDCSDDEDDTESSLVSEGERKTVIWWEEVTFVSEAAERAERIERRDMVIQEIWMNAYLNGSSCEAL
ncbi:protein eva-1 homolog C isoform X1 [Periophthalmus magnuspinnatus]|uniref:protein eva-1 homolog C isoform X1 n=1 Tax=Periophthalmus magnuspinnatus TaxID=409849 RepID=UPI00145B2B62|nr:protein eva-1 homolog C isoform X1 [Periophthalmus magnuspinnatus]